jgi:putative FmdB family regulatory protein
VPTYEYACQSCGTHVEVFQRFSEDPLTECGVCGGPLRKVFHPAGILFKGSGFYATDSRSSRASGSKDKGADKAASRSGETAAGSAGDGASTGHGKPDGGGKKETGTSKAGTSAGERSA